MTSNQERLEELRQQAKTLAEQIEQLEDQLNNTPPTTGLLGRWATNRDGKQVLITADRPVGGWVETAYVADNGSSCENAEQLDSLTFPDQATRPQDVPVGEAWLVDAHNGFDTQPHTPALKIAPGLWVTPTRETADESEWHNYEITLIAPLIPARPQDISEKVFRREEYAELPVGTIVASEHGAAWQKMDQDEWVSTILPETKRQRPDGNMEHRVLRRGWSK
ncbi:hypothetical protein [Corynebacterium sp. ACRQJ]|uniref:hypothetical protein n=1 Tax=Corynebacterium sp. ACRQJ TaxID=2918189 RepID=UPI001EF4F947|nr:hypothetical protein [Corynebacterium sp. ACRQJ]MCG7268406.1 hypothetical protein [Corynebacterium sp. ACRQJ]